MAAVIAPGDKDGEEALVSMTGVFWDTVVICAMTGLALVSAMLRAPELFQGAAGSGLCYLAFSLIPGGGWILTVSLVVFAFATVVGWCWYGECCCRYLWGQRSITVYRILYLAGAFLGVFWGAEHAWSLGAFWRGLWRRRTWSVCCFCAGRFGRACGIWSKPGAIRPTGEKFCITH